MASKLSYGLIIEKQARAKRPKPAKKMRDASEFENEEEFRIIGNENSEDKSLERPSVVKVSEMKYYCMLLCVTTIVTLFQSFQVMKRKKKRGKEKTSDIKPKFI